MSSANTRKATEKQANSDEVELKAMGGMACLVMNVLAELVCTAAFVCGTVLASLERQLALSVVLMVVGALYGFLVGPVVFVGLKVLKPNEALVLTLFGRYYGTLKGAGFYWVNPFCVSVNPASGKTNATTGATGVADQPLGASAAALKNAQISRINRKISLKVMTLNNDM